MFSTNLNKNVLLLQLNTRLIKIEKEFPEVVNLSQQNVEIMKKRSTHIHSMRSQWEMLGIRVTCYELLDDGTKQEQNSLSEAREIEYKLLLKEEHTRLLTLHRMIHTSSDNNIPVDEDTYKFIFNSEVK